MLGTGEFVIVGILPEIAEGLDTSLAAVGKLVSVFAACYAVGTPVITAACGGISRKKLLAVLMGVFLLTGAVSFAAPNVAVLYAARVAAALVSGTLTAVAMLYAKEVAAPEQTARAISLVYGGFSVAAVLGVPLGTAVCQWLGWRWTFAVILVMGAALLPLLLRSLPAVPPRREPGGLLKSFSILRDPRCSLCVGMILCSACATYVVYTYLSPILTDTLGLPEGAVSPVRINLRHIEPGGSVQVVLAEIAGRCGPKPFLLPPVHRLPRQAREAAAAELYFHKADGAVSVPGHQVQLSVPAAPLACQQLAAPLPQVLCRCGLAPVPQGLGGVHVRRASHFFRKVRRWAGQGPYRSSIS